MEALENIAYKLKMYPLWVRILIMVAIPLLWAGQEAFTTLEVLSEQVAGLQGENAALQGKLTKYKEKEKNIIQLKKQLKLTKNQLAQAQKVFPDEYELDTRLAEISGIADRTGVKIQSFLPKEKTTKGEAVKWEEFTLSLSVVGTYMQIALFFDSVNHLPTLIKTRNIKLESFIPKNKDLVLVANSNEGKIAARENTRIRGDADLTLFRAIGEYDSVATAPVGGGPGGGVEAPVASEPTGAEP